MKEFKCRIRVKVNRKSLYDLFKDKPMPKNLSVNDIEWKVVPSDGSKIRQILYAVYDRIIHTHTYFFSLNVIALKNDSG